MKKDLKFVGSNFNQFGFTLAEVLITLGIIGVVAAMTLPTLIQNYTNHVVETRLQKFYSLMNQAVIMAEVEYGDRKDWYEDVKGTEVDDEGKPIKGTSLALNWYNKYLSKYIKTIKITVDDNGTPTFYLADGSAFAPSPNTTRDWTFYSSDPMKCAKKYDSFNSRVGRCSFLFIYCPTASGWKFHFDKGFEPFKYTWDGTESGLYQHCHAKDGSFCAALIQYNNWKIPKDYPFKVSY